MSSLNKCVNCGCEDSFLTTPAPCPTGIGCPDPESCSSISYAQCNIYTGPAIMCGTDLVVPTNTDMETALQAVVDYFCVSPVAYSNVLEFSPSLDSMRYYCNGISLDVVYGTTQSNITDYVTMLNTNVNFSTFGEYFNNGDGRVRLEMPYSVAKTFCPGGTISLDAFYD